MILFGIIVLGLILVIVTWSLVPGYTPPIKDRQGRKLQGSVSSLEKVKLGGQEQWLLMRGTDITKPVILFLHGGPGTSDMGILRKYMHDLEEHFVVVTWDQRGAGKSFNALKPNSSMKIDQFLSDVYELSKLLCLRFKQKKIFLVGHSWGSVLGILSLKDHPELFRAYIGIGQIANMVDNERYSYDWTLEYALNAKDIRAVKTLQGIGRPPYSGDWQKKFMTERRLLGKFGGEVYRSTMGAFPLVIGNLIRSTEYNLMDKVNFFRGIFSTVRLVWPELMTIDLMEMAPKLEVPVYFAIGKHDHEVPFMLSQGYFDLLDAPEKELIWFENSAHMPHIEENVKFIDFVVNRVLKINFSKVM